MADKKSTAADRAPGRKYDAVIEELSQRLQSSKKPTDFIITLIYCMQLLAPIRICLESDIFKRLADSGRPLSAAELADGLKGVPQPSGTDKVERQDFVVRMLRSLCAVGLADETGVFTYEANDLTKAMADPDLAAGFEFIYDSAMGPQSTMASMLPYLKSNDYQAPPSAMDGPYQHARNIAGTSTFDHWVHQDPDKLSRLSTFMQRVQLERPHWTQWFPAEALFGPKPRGAVFVDVGGGRGHDLFALAATYPTSDVRFVLQDLPSVIEEGQSRRLQDGVNLDPRISLSTHNFFEPQPIKGADVYYMHKIMHDWPEVECVKILSHLASVMHAHSRIFVNDVILPNGGCSLL